MDKVKQGFGKAHQHKKGNISWQSQRDGSWVSNGKNTPTVSLY